MTQHATGSDGELEHGSRLDVPGPHVGGEAAEKLPEDGIGGTGRTAGRTGAGLAAAHGEYLELGCCHWSPGHPTLLRGPLRYEVNSEDPEDPPRPWRRQVPGARSGGAG